jgi:predicted nucleic acid-binding Zn ribbon protein
MSFEPISQTIKRNYPQRPLVSAQIIARAQKILGKQAQVVSFNEGTLKLEVEDNMQAANLRLRSSGLIQKINKCLGKELVERIVFRLG